MQDHFTPAPRLVCIEENPGPGRPRKQRLKQGQHSDDVSKGMVVGMHLAGASIHKISNELRIDRRSVRKTVHKYEDTGKVGSAHRGGRKRKIEEKERKQMATRAKKGKSAHQLADEYEQKTGDSIDQATIRRILKGEGLAYMKKRRKERLTKLHKQKRLSYAKEMLENKYEWKYVLFTDEKTFYLGTEETMGWQDPKDRAVVETSQYVPKLNVWGGIGYYFKTPLYFFSDNLDASLYQKILKARLPPYYFTDCPARRRQDWIFLQDGARPHTSKETTAYLDRTVPDRIKNHPPMSPDFNCIEDIWSYMDREIRKIRNIKDTKELEKQLKKIWNNVPLEQIRVSVKSMPRRLAACVKLRGDRTLY